MKLSHSTALWIFERLGLDLAFVGDLLEERARGRSMFWFLKEILAAVWVGTWSAISGHKLLALRAVATGCAVEIGWLFLGRALRLETIAKPTFFVGLIIVVTNILAQMVTGWIVARTHRTHPVPMVFAFGLCLFLLYLPSIDFPYLGMPAVDSIDQPRFRPYLIGQLERILVANLMVLGGLFAGGIVGARPTSRSIVTPHR